MSYIRILYQVNQKYLHITEATVIPFCRRAKIKNITLFIKAFRKTKVSLGPCSHLIRIHPPYRLLSPFYHGNVTSDIWLATWTSSQSIKVSLLSPCISLIVCLYMSRNKSSRPAMLVATGWERCHKVPLNFHTKWSL